MRGPGGQPAFHDLRIPLLGDYQLDNATAAVAILQQLRNAGVAIGDAAIFEGLAGARWPGRFEVLKNSVTMVVDSAHNENSALKLRGSLAAYFPRPPRRRLCLVFGASADKDIEGMLRQFLEPASVTGYQPADKVIVTKSVQSDLSSAITEALAWARQNDLIIITGSIFAVAQARRDWAHRHPEAFAADDWVWQDETAGEVVPD